MSENINDIFLIYTTHTNNTQRRLQSILDITQSQDNIMSDLMNIIIQNYNNNNITNPNPTTHLPQRNYTRPYMNPTPTPITNPTTHARQPIHTRPITNMNNDINRLNKMNLFKLDPI